MSKILKAVTKNMYTCKTLYDEKRKRPLLLIFISSRILENLEYCENYYDFKLSIEDKEKLLFYINQNIGKKEELKMIKSFLSPVIIDTRKRSKDKLLEDAQKQAFRLLKILYIANSYSSSELISQLKENLLEFVENTEKYLIFRDYRKFKTSINNIKTLLLKYTDKENISDIITYLFEK